MIEPVCERGACDAHAEPGRVGEVGQSLASGRMFLPEDHLPLGAVHRLPEPDAAFKGAARVGGEVEMATLHLPQDGERP